MHNTLISNQSKQVPQQQSPEKTEQPSNNVPPFINLTYKSIKNVDLLTPITTSLQSEFEQMTLDTSPKESQYAYFVQDTIQEEQHDYIDENKLKFQAQKQLSFNYQRESMVRRQQKNKTCQPIQTSPTSPQKHMNHEIIQEVSSPHSQESSKEQQLKYIKELWNNHCDLSPTAYSPQAQNNQILSQRVIPQMNEQKYFEEIQAQQQVLNPPAKLDYGQLLYSQGNSFYSQDVSPQLYYEPDIEMDIYITGLIDQLWGNQLISRKLQKMLESGTDEQKELIVQKLERISPQIQKDVFGNYVVQKIFECTHHKVQLKMFNKLKTHFYDLSKNTFGCRVMQKIIEFTFSNDGLQTIVLQQLQANTRSLIYDVNGNYVIFKMLETYDKSKMEFLIPIVEESFNYMSQQIYGCKIIHKLIQQYTQSQIQNLIKLSVSNYALLSQTEYGNYILQHILQHWYPSSEKSKLVQMVIQQFYQLSINKYASNTVERALEVLGKQELSTIMSWLLCRSPNQYNSYFVVLANHQYANYVIKKFLVLSDSQILKIIGDHLRSNAQEYQTIKSTVHGQRISSLLERQLSNWG